MSVGIYTKADFAFLDDSRLSISEKANMICGILDSMEDDGMAGYLSARDVEEIAAKANAVLDQAIACVP